jgi:hypothetical protein
MALSCPTGSYPSGVSNKCYTFYDIKLDYLSSLTFCSSKASKTPIISSSQENRDIALHLLGKTWIGLDDRDREGTYIWLNGFQGPSYSNWAYHQPDNAGTGGEDCVEMRTLEGEWNDAPCAISNYVSCYQCASGSEYNSDNKQCTLCPVGTYSDAGGPCTKCPSGTFALATGSSFCSYCPFGYFSPEGSASMSRCTYPISCPTGTQGPSPEGKCYKFTPLAKNYLDSLNYCFSQNGFLPIISSQEENQYITTRLTGDSWIGLDDMGSESNYVWTAGGTSPHYTNWYSGEPSNSYSNEDCAEIHFNGRWNSQICTQERFVVCSQCAIGTELTSNDRCALCPLGYFATNGDCKVCPVGKYSSDYGMRACNDCPSGFTSAPGSSTCFAAPTLAPSISPKPSVTRSPTQPGTTSHQCQRVATRSIDEACAGANCAFGLTTIIGRGYDITKALEPPSRSIMQRLYEFSGVPSSVKLDGLTYSVPPIDELHIDEWDHTYTTIEELSSSYDSVRSHSLGVSAFLGLSSVEGVGVDSSMARKVSESVTKSSYTMTHYSAITKAKYMMQHPFPDGGYLCDKSFFDELNSLPETYNIAIYRDLISIYGTHVIIGAEVGGYISQSISRKAKKYSKKSKVETDAGIFRQEISDFTVNSQQSEVVILGETVSKQLSFICGGDSSSYTSPASSQSNWEAWASSLTSNPLCPVRVILIPISELATTPTLRQNLDIAVADYLEYVKTYSRLSDHKVKPKKKKK